MEMLREARGSKRGGFNREEKEGVDGGHRTSSARDHRSRGLRARLAWRWDYLMVVGRSRTVVLQREMMAPRPAGLACVRRDRARARGAEEGDAQGWAAGYCCLPNWARAQAN